MIKAVTSMFFPILNLTAKNLVWSRAQRFDLEFVINTVLIEFLFV